MDRKQLFIAGVLGADGAQALKKAADRSPEFSNAILPRVIMAWMQVVGRFDYEGELPGVQNTYLEFSKSEDLYTGAIGMGDEVYSFKDVSLFHVASAVAVALGAENARIDPQLRDVDLMRLGKSIDLLAKARIVQEKLSKQEPKKVEDEEVEKVEAPGEPVMREQKPPAAQSAPKVRQAAKLPKPSVKTLGQTPQTNLAAQPEEVGPRTKGTIPNNQPLQRSLKITKAQAERECPYCSGKQINRDRFVGCLCFKSMAKSVSLVPNPNGYTLTFKSADWDEEAISVLLESIGV
jgi:hypothetical protein